MSTNHLQMATVGWLRLVAVGIALTVARSAIADSPSELLQKAIYTEETVGNLDEAMKLYEQVIAAGNAGQEAAAQAQYRLALCYEKKGRDADAKSAFEMLVKNYPNAKDLVAEAQKHLPSRAINLLPEPWILGERAQFNMKLPTGLPIGTMIYMVDGAQHNGKNVTRCSTRGLVTINNASSFSWVLCESESFRPIESFWKHSLLGEATTNYSDSSVEITLAGKQDPVEIDFTPPAFDNEQGVELFRRLPLAIGYKSTVTVIPILTASKVDLGLEVPEKESITVPAGTFECYKLVLSIGQTFWISADEHRYLVRFAAGGVTADLVKVWQAEPGQVEKFTNNVLPLTLPKGWQSYDMKSDDAPDHIELALLDPSAIALSQVVAKPASTLDEKERGSTKVWTESFVKGFTKMYGDFHIDEPGLVETTVDGHAATEIVASFTDGGKKMKMLGVAVVGDKTAASMRFSRPADKFDSLRKDFDAIVASIQLD